MKINTLNNDQYLLNTSRIELYLDFIINLINNIITYYFDEINENKRRSHFDWCYDKTCDDYFLEGLFFYDNDKLKEYLYTYFNNQFYTVQNNENYNKTTEHFIQFWTNIFDLKKNITNNKLKLLVEIYTIFDISVNSRKKILNV